MKIEGSPAIVKSFDIFAGGAQHGFNAGVELCERWAQSDRVALR